MTQLNKTLIFLCVAAVVMVAVLLTWPAPLKQDAANAVGEKLVTDFDPLLAADLEIIEFNEATGELRPFEVKQVESKGKTRWSIPSHNNYPADAKDQVGLAATSLLGLEILGVKGDSQDDHETYGVNDSKEGGRGVGMKVTLRDKNGKDLVSLIIGKEVPDRKGQRYVRLAGQKPVYIVEMKTDNLSTRFDRWIEKSLLQINPWDLSKIWIRDHNIDADMVLHEREEMILEYNDKSEPHWKMLEDRQQDEKTKKWLPVEMAADETLNAPKLDELKSALGDLKIVDVERKPEGLSADLKASEDFIKSRPSMEALAERGYLVGKIGKSYELYSNNGEIRCLMNDGVEYILRFGDVAFDTAPSGSSEEKAKDAKEGQAGQDEKKTEKKATGSNRYLFVMAQFNQAAIAKPQETPLPGEMPAEGATPPAKEAVPADNQPAPDSNPVREEMKKPADENAPATQEEKKPVDAKPASYLQQKPDEDKPADAQPAPTVNENPATAQNQPAITEKPAEDQKTPDATEKPAEDKPATVLGQPEENPVALPTDPKALEAEREKVEKENRRKRDEYEKKVDAGKKRVEELNARFADWFYIISDETYQKIHLSRENLVIKKSEKKDEKPGESGDLPPGMGMPPGFPMPQGK